jgi:hypothetical protein
MAIVRGRSSQCVDSLRGGALLTAVDRLSATLSAEALPLTAFLDGSQRRWSLNPGLAAMNGGNPIEGNLMMQIENGLTISRNDLAEAEVGKSSRKRQGCFTIRPARASSGRLV